MHTCTLEKIILHVHENTVKFLTVPVHLSIVLLVVDINLEDACPKLT